VSHDYGWDYFRRKARFQPPKPFEKALVDLVVPIAEPFFSHTFIYARLGLLFVSIGARAEGSLGRGIKEH
jgi:hypothetical protein